MNVGTKSERWLVPTTSRSDLVGLWCEQWTQFDPSSVAELPEYMGGCLLASGTPPFQNEKNGKRNTFLGYRPQVW